MSANHLSLRLVAYAALDSGGLESFSGILALGEDCFEDGRSLRTMSITAIQKSPANPINKPIITSVIDATSHP